MLIFPKLMLVIVVISIYNTNVSSSNHFGPDPRILEFQQVPGCILQALWPEHNLQDLWKALKGLEDRWAGWRETERCGIWQERVHIQAHMCTHACTYTESGRLLRVTVLLASGNHA